MPFEFLERKKKAIEDVIAAYRAFQSALQELPPEWAKEVVEELVSAGVPLPPPATPKANAQAREHLPTPTDAVRDLLRKHPDGMRPSEVVNALIGKINTTSGNEAKLLYSVLGTLKNSGQLKKGSDGRFRIAAKADENANI